MNNITKIPIKGSKSRDESLSDFFKCIKDNGGKITEEHRKEIIEDYKKRVSEEAHSKMLRYYPYLNFPKK